MEWSVLLCSIMKLLLSSSIVVLLSTTVARADDGWRPPAPEREAPSYVADLGPEPPADPETPRPIFLGVRAAVGSGGATNGMLFGGSADMDVWIVGPLGIGGRVAAMWASEIFGDSASLVLAEPLVLLKLGGPNSYLRIGMGIGLGSSYTHEYLDTETSCFLGECGPEVERERIAVVGSINMAILWHPGPVELGPTFALDAADGQVYFTAGFTIGGAVRAEQ